MKPTRDVLVLAAALATVSAFALDLKSPFDLETTKVLPKGVRNPRIKNVTMSVDSKYDSLGTALPLGDKLNKTVSWQDIVDAQPDQGKKDDVTGVLAANGIPFDGSPGRTTGQVTTLANVMVPTLAVGITDRWTAAVAVPVMNIQVNADTGFIKSDDGQKFVDAACKSDVTKCNEAKEKLNNAVNQKLSRLGYEPVSSKTVSGIGDVRLVNKYQLPLSERESLGFKQDLSLPTGKAPNADRALDVPTGEGHVNAGLTFIHDIKPFEYNEFNINTYAGYLYQFQDRIDRRLPKSADDSLSSDKETLTRKAGDVISAGTGVSYEFLSTGFTLGGGYAFQYMAPTKFDGSKYDINRYRLLDSMYPSQTIHSGVATAGFSTVHFYHQKKFVYPFQANLAYSRPFAGRNVTTNSVIAAELVLFF